ncbi:MAG: SAF domain-containing protein [Clostridia bacterium]
MIGMGQIKRKQMQGIAIGIAIGIVGIAATIWICVSIIKTYQEGTNKSYNKTYTQMVAVLTKDVIQGENITNDMVSEVRVHKSTVPTGALSISDIVGQVAKFNIAANVPLTSSMITTEIIAADIRIQEINTILMPSDLKEGENIDVRIMFPNGTDYIVLAQKQVSKIAGATMWLKLGEDERLILNSAMVDSFLNEGTKLYATKYADSDAQIKISDDASNKAQGYVTEEIKKEMSKIKTADEKTITDMLFNLVIKYKNFAATVTRTAENYQPNSQVMAMMKTNTIILDQAKEKLSNEARANIESGINSYESITGDKYSNVVSGAQSSINNQKTTRNEIITGATTKE